VTNPAVSTSPVNDLADRFWEGILELSPTTATVYGDERFNDRLPDPGPEGRQRLRTLMENAKRDAAAISIEGRPVEERITLDMIQVVCDLTLLQDDQRIDELKVVDQLEGPQQTLPVITQFQPADTPERFEQFIARLHSYPAYISANTELLR